MKLLKLSLIFSLVFIMAGQASAQRKKKQKDRFVLIMTDSGEIKVRLYNETPLHRDNFLKLVKEEFYDGLLFHRVVKNFVIQGGDPDSREAEPDSALGEGGPGYTLEAEIIPEFFHRRGVLAAAREPDKVNPKKESSGSQFYIVQGRVYNNQELNIWERQKKDTFTDEERKVYTTEGGAMNLDGAYTIFGEVVEGMDVVDKIATMPVDSRGRPKVDIRMWMKIVKR